ncbi:MAG: hypothetical protein F9K16_03950 [Thermoanaerobaculia bacterium]|nr:MAG: hypothetical protein F9K16_03950 [Thermoanaerobaculia bacterium]MBZ0102465.1 hypothetical protein [Thermoanaerobaculia bacterium]
MTASGSPLHFTATELRSYLPSGWGLVEGRTGTWNPSRSSWIFEAYDGADNTWEIVVDAGAATKEGRFEALKAAITRVQRKGLGRKSVLLG